MRGLDKVLAVLALSGVALAVCWLGYQQDQTRQDLTTMGQAVEDAANENVVRERVVDLPEDGNLYYTTVFVHADWRKRPEERRLMVAFKVEPALVSLVAQTHFNLYTPNDPDYKERFEGVEVPCVLVQTESGEVIYKASGENIPTASAMVGELVTFFDKRPWLRIRPWKRPRPCPTPDPDPKPDGKVKPDRPNIDVDVKIPDLRPTGKDKQPTESSDVWLVMAIAVAIAGVGTGLYYLRHGGSSG